MGIILSLYDEKKSTNKPFFLFLITSMTGLVEEATIAHPALIASSNAKQKVSTNIFGYAKI